MLVCDGGGEVKTVRIIKTIVIVIVVVLVFAVLVGLAQWVKYTETPQYSLARIALEFNEGDWVGFKHYVDVVAVSDQIAETVIKQRLGETGGDLGLGEVGEPLVKSAQPLIAEQVQKRIYDTVNRREGKNGLYDFIGAIRQTRNPKRLRVEDDEAFLTVDFTFSGQPRELDLVMVDQGGSWKVTRIENVEELLGEW